MYGTRSNARPHGTVFTKPEVVEAMLDLLKYQAKNNLSEISVLDPCGGEGAFICACLERLSASAHRHGFSFAQAYQQLKVIELNPALAHALKEQIIQTLHKLDRLPEVLNPATIVYEGDFLTYSGPAVDIVVGNPPYVRHENLPEALKLQYRALFSAFRHRADLYIAFYQKGLQLLKPGGRLSFICANRWLKNQAGQSLRALIAQAYHFEWNINLEQTQPFAENVYGYASITQIQKGPPQAWPAERQLSHLAELNGLEDRALSVVEKTPSITPTFPLALIEAQGFQIGIGVATGADKIFVGQHLPEVVEADFVLPLVLAKDIQGQQVEWSRHYVLNPWNEKGQLRSLADYPCAQAYLTEHFEILSQRYVARKSPQRWYQPIDKIKVDLTREAKILLADIANNHWVSIDSGQYYPHHNLYYIAGGSQQDLQLLACFLMSAFVRKQMQALSPLMSGGYTRWQSQHLRKLQVPVIRLLPATVKQALLAAYGRGDLLRVQSLAEEVLEMAGESDGGVWGHLPLFAGV